MNITRKDVDWKSLLIKRYLSYDLDETDVMVIFVSDALLGIEPKTLLTCDILSAYMKAKREDIDQSLTKLIDKKYMIIDTEAENIYSSVSSFKDRLFDDYIKDVSLRSRNRGTQSSDSDSVYSKLEELTGHMLSPIERDMVTNWIKEGATDGMIYEACQKSLTKSGNISFKTADKKILEMERSKDRKDIGVSTIDEDTKKKRLGDILGKTDWLDK
ncbi:MAG: DnaD domain protein [Bacilli bacterium]